MMMPSGDLASAVALAELSAALNAVDAPFSLLPDVKNKDGESIQDVKEKRLALVRQHVEAAGAILNAKMQAVAQTDMALQAMLATKYRDVLLRTLRNSGMPPEAEAKVIAMFDRLKEQLPPELLGDGCSDPGCDSCGNGEKDPEPARQFGFGAVRK